MDTVTGLSIWSAEAITLAVLLLSRWFFEREAFYLTWGCGFGLHSAGALLVALRGDIPDFVSIEVANTMLLLGLGAWIAGFLQFDQKPVEGFVAIPALIWVAAMFLTPVRETFAYRIVTYNLAVMVGHGILITHLLQGGGSSRPTRRFLAGLILVMMVANGASALSALLTKPQSFIGSGHAAWLLFPAAFCAVGCIAAVAKLLGERSEEKLRVLAVTDPLTGVLNRRGMIEEFHRLKHIDDRSNPFLAILHFDLDRFKQINDRHGHKIGDDVLVAFSRIGTAALRGRGSFGRMGGEEFAAMMRLPGPIEAASIAEAIRTTLKRQRIMAKETSLTASVSIGVTLAPAQSADLDALLVSADRALYAAKNAGRDRTAIAESGGVALVPPLDTESPMAPLDEVSLQVAALKQLSHLGKN